MPWSRARVGVWGYSDEQWLSRIWCAFPHHFIPYHNDGNNRTEEFQTMTDRWTVEIELWPFHGYKQEECAPRTINLTVEGDNVRQALKQAEMFVSGCLTNHRVFQARINSLTRAATADLFNDVGEWRGMLNIMRDDDATKLKRIVTTRSGCRARPDLTGGN